MKNVLGKVKNILIECPCVRGDDHLLYYLYVLKEAKRDGVRDGFDLVFQNYKSYGLPSFESVGRARRKVQQRFPELKPNKDVEEARLRKEIEYYNLYKGE